MTDTRIVGLVVAGLILVALTTSGGAVWLLAAGKSAESMVGLASTAVGALAGILASTRTKPAANGGGQ